MKIEIDVDEAYSDTAIIIHTPRLTPDTEKLISLIRMLNMQIAVKRYGETHLLDTEKILYIEAVERSTFVYTEDATPTNQISGCMRWNRSCWNRAFSVPANRAS